MTRASDGHVSARRSAGLCVPLRSADAFMSDWRSKHDWTAACGLPAHVTVYMPFPSRLHLDPERLAPVLAEHLPIEITLARLEDRPGALVAVVEPDDRLRALTEGIGSLDPSFPPHHGGEAHLYHATIVRTADAALRRRAWDSVSAHLPHREAVSEVWRFDWEGEDLAVVWRAHVG